MELSELTTDESIATQPHQIFLPGCFVVLQGISGDGLANTIETHPEYSHPGEEEEQQHQQQQQRQQDGDGDHVMQEATTAAEEATEAPPLEEDHFRRPNQDAGTQTLPPAAGTNLLSQLTSNQNPTFALNNPVINRSPATTAAATAPIRAVAEVQSDGSPPAPSPPDDSFVVVNTQEDPNSSSNAATTPTTTPNATTSPTRENSKPNRRKQQAVLQWNQDRVQRQQLQRQEWQIQQQQHHQPRQPTSSHNSQQQQQHTNDWWLDPETGQLAIFDGLPPKHKKIGCLPPGSTMTALKLYTLDSETFKLIHVDEERSNAEDKPPLPPSLGVAQVLEIQWNGTTTSSPSSSTTTTNSNDSNLILADTPAKIGYCAYSVHGYAFLVPGIATLYMNPQVWWWRVTCRVGAFLRQGLELSSDHQCTIPYGSFVQVTRKTVNRMGLSRLKVVAHIEGQQRAGWCSEFLNPLSGQRGHVVQPLPFAVPAVYRVTLPEGAVIREDVELSSRQIGLAPCGTLLTIVQRRFSEHPQDQCVERLKLAGGKSSGWISVRLNQIPPQDRCVVELVGVDPRFQPNQPGDFHWQVLDEERIRQQEQAASLPNANGTSSSGGDLSSVDEGSSQDDQKPKAMNGGSTGTTAGLKKKKPQVDTCLICLTEERNATIVHGETGHIACCLVCARILKARGDRCPVCRLEIDSVIQHFWA